MFPRTSNRYISNCFGRNVIHSGDCTLAYASGAQFADFPYILFGKFRGIDLFAMCLPSLTYLVLGVLLGRGRKEMVGVTARRIVTAVTNILGLVDSSVKEAVSNAVGINSFTVNLNSTITSTGFHSLPFPTLVDRTASNFTPKSGLKRYDSVHVSHTNIVPYTHYQGKVMS